MKLTWFGGETFRIHAAGMMIVVKGAGLLPGVEPSELISGADVVVDFAEAANASVSEWKPRAALKTLEVEEVMRRPEIVGLGQGAMVIDADGEAPLVLTTDDAPAGGRWMVHAVVVLAGANLAQRGLALLERNAPRLIALAGEEPEIDAAFVALRDKLDGTGLVALERALAVEV
jgi:hypothetical protein